MKDISYDIVVSYPKNGHGAPFLRKTAIKFVTTEPEKFTIPSGRTISIPKEIPVKLEIDSLQETVSLVTGKRLLFRRTKKDIRIYTPDYIETICLVPKEPVPDK